MKLYNKIKWSGIKLNKIKIEYILKLYAYSNWSLYNNHVVILIYKMLKNVKLTTHVGMRYSYTCLWPFLYICFSVILFRAVKICCFFFGVAKYVGYLWCNDCRDIIFWKTICGICSDLCIYKTSNKIVMKILKIITWFYF